MRILRPRFTLDMIGLAIAAAMYLLALALRSPSMDLLVGIATSFVFVAMIDLLAAGQANLINRRRILFFGHELASVRTTFVYPIFSPDDEILALLREHGRQMRFVRPQSEFRDIAIHRVDVPFITASNDIQALLYVAEVFESTPHCPNVTMIDSEVVRNCDRSFISFGLSSNDCTHLYLNEDRAPLFSVGYDEDGTEYVRLPTGEEYRSNGRRQYGLILRYAPDPEDYPERRWFLVAGRGPVGTTGAAWYLAHEWRRLAREVPANRDFVAVISTGSYTDHHPVRERLLVRDRHSESAPSIPADSVTPRSRTPEEV